MHESPIIMLIPLSILAFGSIFSGIFFSDYYIGNLKENFWNNSIYLSYTKNHYLPFIQTLIIKTSVAFGLLIAAYLYFYNKSSALLISNKFKTIYNFSLNKWYIDELYNIFFVNPYFNIAKIFWKKGDEKIIDYYGPNGISRLVSFSSIYLSRFQSGYVYHYAFAMLGGLIIILTWFLYY